MQHALGDAAHDFRLGGLQGSQGGLGVARGDGFLNLADEAADAGLALGIDGGALGRGARALLGGGDIGHQDSLDSA